MYHAKNCYVKIDNTEMEYVAFGNGTQPFIIIPGLGDALKTVRGTAVPFSYMYRTYAKYFKVYLFSRKNMIPKDYTIADMADDQAKVLKTLGISDACVMGVSQGGMISMHLAAKYPELVTKLVLANTAPYANDVIKTVVGCSRPKLLSKIFKIIVKNFREIFSVLQTEKGSDFTHYPFLSSGFHVPQLSGVFPSWGSYLVSPQSAHPQNNQALHIYGQCVLPLN